MAVRTQLTYLEGCAGVGMLGEGLRAGLDFLGIDGRCVGYIERDAYAAATLVARMEDAALDRAPIWDDLATFDGRAWRGRVDCFTAGFPCQPWSSAGKQGGIEDERWLWPAIARIIRDAEPALVYLENVPGLVSGGGLHFVLDDLAEMGFDAEWCHLTAESVGASHRRERVFILAYAKGGRSARGSLRSGAQSQHTASNGARGNMGDTGLQHEQLQQRQDGSEHSGASSAVGNANGARAGEHAARSGPRDSTGEPSAGLADTEREGSQGDGPAGPQRGSEPVARDRDWGIFAPGPSDPQWADILRDSPHLAPAIEPGVRVLVDGLALVVDQSRADQLRCAGNGVVPCQAAAAFIELSRRAGLLETGK